MIENVNVDRPTRMSHKVTVWLSCDGGRFGKQFTKADVAVLSLSVVLKRDPLAPSAATSTTKKL